MTNAEVFKSLFAQRTSRSRPDLKTCPFCGTRALEQAVPHSKPLWRIICGNPFCDLDCATKPCASLDQAEATWQERAAG